MRNDRDMSYGDFNRDYQQHANEPSHGFRFQGRVHANLGDTRNEPGEHYRLQQSRQYGRQGAVQGNREERYNQMYDISNYSDHPRSSDYGLPYGVENDLDYVDRFPYNEGPYGRNPRNFSYSPGNNPNYDNPAEGDRYRDFDSRGNHGFRHSGGYGNEGDFRDFGNDHYGNMDRSNRNDERY
ncbi:hypothetical protein ACXYMU_08720 [Pontibacter sp. CAU 1760]